MESPDKEVLKGALLERWMEDLRQDRAPSLLPGLQQLSQQEIEETLTLARWLTAMTPASPTVSEVDSVTASVRARIHQDDEQQGQELATVVEQATSFGGLLLVARGSRQLKPLDIERALRLPSGTLTKLENAVIPPHRIPIDTMLTLLRLLRITTSEVVELIHQAGVQWANKVYAQPASQLGRIDSQLDIESRGHLLAEATAQEDQHAELAEELESVESYCRSLAAAQLR